MLRRRLERRHGGKDDFIFEISLRLSTSSEKFFKKRFRGDFAQDVAFQLSCNALGKPLSVSVMQENGQCSFQYPVGIDSELLYEANEPAGWDLPSLCGCGDGGLSDAEDLSQLALGLQSRDGLDACHLSFESM